MPEQEEFKTNIVDYVRNSGKRVLENYEYEKKFIPGTYVCTNVPVEEVAEWEGTKQIYIVISTNDIGHLILENNAGEFSFAPGSENCYWNENSIFFGPNNNGLCFYFQRGSNCLYTVFSPFGLQIKMRFDRTPETFDLSKIRKSQNLICSGSSFTNYLYYTVAQGTKYGVNREKKLSLRLSSIKFEEMAKIHANIMRSREGLYERKPDENELKINIKAVYLLISDGKGDIIINIDGTYYLRNSNYPIIFDECFANSHVYIATSDSITTLNVFWPCIGPLRDIRTVWPFSLPWFQRKQTYKRVAPIEMDVVCTKYLFYQGKKIESESTMEWFYLKFRFPDSKDTVTYTL
jgi:hypothetical protein